jgi:hypothetical protein
VAGATGLRRGPLRDRAEGEAEEAVLLIRPGFVCTLVVLWFVHSARAGDPWRAFWIWDNPQAGADAQPAGDRFFRHTFTLDSPAIQSHTLVLVDNRFALMVNGAQLAKGEGPWPPVELDISKHLRAGRNVIAIAATNADGPAGRRACNDPTPAATGRAG